MAVATEERKKNSLPYNYKLVESVLREGKQSATTTRDILTLTGLKDQRQIHEIIEQLIMKYGYVIGASRKGKYRGYYLVSNQDELKDTLHSYNEQIQTMLKRHKQLLLNYNKLNR